MSSHRTCIVDVSSQVLPFTWGLVRRLKGKGINIEYVGSSTNYNGNFLGDMKGDVDSIHLFDISSSTGVSTLRRWLNIFRFYIFLFRKSSKFDEIIVQFPMILPLDLLYFCLFGRKISYIIHNPYPHSSKSKIDLSTLILSLLSNKIYFLTDYVKDQYQSIYTRVKSSNMQVIGHGLIPIDPKDHLLPYRKVLSFPLTLTYWGNVKPYKGVSRLASYIQKNYKADIIEKLEIHGKVDASLQSEILGFSSDTIMINDSFLSSEEVQSLFTGNRLFILPYEAASQSGILYTLIFYGQIFISSDAGDTSQFLKSNGLEQLVYDIHSPDTLYQSILYCVENVEQISFKLSQLRQEYLNDT
tara:strand:- start:2413 stop:3480 length:1068 start_codon:yes stop_codon:yes gene_type:complete